MYRQLNSQESLQNYFDDSLNFRRLLLLVAFLPSGTQGVETTRLEVIVCYSGYFDDCCEKLATYDKPVYIIYEFNIDLLKTEKSPYSHNFLLSLQSYHLKPTIDRVRSLFEQKFQGLFKDFQGHISHFSKTHSQQKTALSLCLF